jgi:hypothetical protein
MKPYGGGKYAVTYRSGAPMHVYACGRWWVIAPRKGR